MPPLNPYVFSDKLNSDAKLREEFVTKYVDMLIDSMDHDDLIRSLKDSMMSEHMTDLRINGADGLVEQVGIDFPNLLQDTYDVDTSLLADI